MTTHTNTSNFFISLFWPVKSATSSKFINAPVEAVLKVLHDPTAVIKLDPLVHTCTRSTQQTGLWNVVDRINILKWWNISFRYTATFHSAPDGVTIDVQANKFLSMRNTWQVRGSKEGTEVSMEVQSKAFVLLMPFLAGSIQKNHDTMLNGLVAKFDQPPRYKD